jgi:8-oxo-dGTP pyrophosphatase MutT (NUDIX family)
MMPVDHLSPEQLREHLRNCLAPEPTAGARTGHYAPALAYGRHRGPADPGARKAAVMILFYPWQTQWHVPLTLRPEHLANHGGQISLPGGAVEPGEDAEQCALRELHEELGVAVDMRSVAGRLSPVYVYGSEFLVVPVVSVLDRRPDFSPQASEVAELFEVPASHLADTSNFGSHLIARRSVRFRSPHIDFHGRLIWGATRMILAEFDGRLRDWFGG